MKARNLPRSSAAPLVFGLVLLASYGAWRLSGIRKLPAIDFITAIVSNSSAPALHAEQAGSASAFVDSIGVQTHINYIDTPYANWSQVIDKLTELGVRHVRDALPMTPTFVRNHHDLSAAGIRCTCGFTLDSSLTAEAIVQAARSATDLEALEAPNECDAGTNCGGGGKIGVAHVVAALPVYANAARMLNVPFVGPSFTTAEAYAAAGDLSRSESFSNLHVYFGGRNPGTEGWGAGDAQGHRYGSIDWWLDQSHLSAPGLPIQITETGYEAFDRPPKPGTVPATVESAYVLRTVLLAWNHSVRRTFLYELLDEFPGSGYGLLRHDLSEKPAYVALKNLLSLLRDPSAKPMQPGRLKLSIAGAGPSLTHTLLQKSDGSYELILWLEQSSYNAELQTATAIAPESVRVDLEPQFGVAETTSFNEDGSTITRQRTKLPSSLATAVSGQLTVLRIVPRKSAASID